MEYYNLKFTQIKESTLIASTGEEVKIESGDSYADCEFLCDVDFKYTDFRNCKFNGNKFTISYCTLYDAVITSNICNIGHSRIGWSTIKSVRLDIYHSNTVFSEIKAKELYPTRSICTTTYFYFENKKGFYPDVVTFLHCKANGNKLSFVHKNDIFAYTDTKNVWVGCQAFSVGLVKRYIDDEKRVTNLANKLEIGNTIHKYVKVLKFLLDLD